MSDEGPGDGTGAESGSGPARRGRLAAARASELRRRLIELAGGGKPTPSAAEFARRRALQAVVRAEDAHESALTRHDETRRVHLRAAATHEQAAVLFHGLDSDGHQRAAERHRDAAAAHAAVIESSAESAAEVGGRVSPRPPPSTTRR